MADYGNIIFENPFLDGGIGGGKEYDKITQEAIDNLIDLDRMAFCGQHQLLYSFTKNPLTVIGDTKHDRGFETLVTVNGARGAQCFATFYYTIPDVLPGSTGNTTSTGTSLTDRGYLSFAANLEYAGAFVRIEPLAIAGSYGQSTTYAGGTQPSAFASNFGATRRYVGANCLLPSGVTAGDLVEVQCWCLGDRSNDGLIQSFGIFAPRTINLADYP
jgi:hypothetical protein